MKLLLIILSTFTTTALCDDAMIKRGTEQRIILYSSLDPKLPPQVLTYSKSPETINDVPIFLTDIKDPSINSGNSFESSNSAQNDSANEVTSSSDTETNSDGLDNSKVKNEDGSVGEGDRLEKKSGRVVEKTKSKKKKKRRKQKKSGK